MKIKSEAKKRFRVRPGGTVKRGQAFKRPLLTKKKTSKRIRDLRGITIEPNDPWPNPMKVKV